MRKHGLRYLYISSGTGTGTIVKAVSLWRAGFIRDVKVGFAMGTDFPEKLPDDPYGYKSTWKPNTHDLTFELAKAVDEFEPDAIISCYITSHIQEYLRWRKIPAYLIWHQMNNSANMVRPLLPDTFEKVLSFEQWGMDMMQEQVGDRYELIPPFYSVDYEHALLPQDKARQVLLDTWDMNSTRPLRVIAHNGFDADEVDAVIQAGMAQRQHHIYTTVAISDQPGSNAHKLDMPLTIAMKGIDHLIAAPSPTLYWEWKRYKRLEATETWVVVPRAHDPQAIRMTQEKPWTGWDGVGNGADAVHFRIWTDLNEKGII